MTFEQIAAGLGVIVGAWGWLDNRFAMRERFAKLEVKVDTMWTFTLRRAEVEAVNLNLATKNSPLHVSKEALSFYDEIAPELRNFYARQGRHLTIHEMTLEIERLFGRRISDEVCIPRKISFGSCLIFAMAVATGDLIVEVP